MIAGHQHAIGGGAIEQFFAGRDGSIPVDIESRLPIGMAREHGRMLRGIAEHQQRLIPGMDRTHGVTRRVARRRERQDAGRDFGSRLEAGDAARDIGKYPPLIAEGEFLFCRRRVHIGVVHPERPFRRRHYDLGIGEDDTVVLVLDAVDVVGMEMRDDDEINRLRIDAGGGEVLPQRAGRGRDLAAGTGVDEYELLPVLTTSVVNGVVSLSGGMKASASACSTSANGALRMNLSLIGRYQMPS